MRFMLIVKGDKRSEAGELPTAAEFDEMNKFNEELVQSGVMLAGEGLQPTSSGARVKFSKRKPTVVDGPFAEAKELVAGYWIIQAKSREEAIEWARRAPFEDGEIEVRQIFETEDFAAVDPTGQLRAKENELRERIEAQQHH